MIFRCINKCQYRNRIWRVDDEIEMDEQPEDLPRHFVKVTAEETVATPIVVKEPEEFESLDELRDECDRLEIPYDRRWGFERLKNELWAAKKNRGL